MRKVLKKGLVLLLAVTLLTGCSSAKETSSKSENEEPVYPISINGKDIVVGETTVQTLLDEGLMVTVSEMSEDYEITQYEIDPEAQLEPDSYYTGASIFITDHIFANISLVTDEEAIRMGDAVIAYFDLSLVSAEKSDMDKIAFNGISANDLDRTRAGEEFPDFTGDENMWLLYGRDYKYDLDFNSDGVLTSMSAERKYDVDWSGGEE